MRMTLSFTITGEPGLYDKFNTNGELDVYDGENDGHLSSQFIKDRSQFLFNLANPEATVASLESDLVFTDSSQDFAIEVDNSKIDGWNSNRHCSFGHAGSDNFQGESKNDRFYGMDGHDVFNARGGDD